MPAAGADKKNCDPFVHPMFGGDYSRMGFWSGMIYVVGMVIIWFAPKSAPELAD